MTCTSWCCVFTWLTDCEDISSSPCFHTDVMNSVQRSCFRKQSCSVKPTRFNRRQIIRKCKRALGTISEVEYMCVQGNISVSKLMYRYLI